MAFSPLSFLLGLGTAYLLPVVTRGFRPIAVEATALGIGLMEDARRVVAEQLENFEDVMAEARARREEIAGAAHHDGGEPGDLDETASDRTEASSPPDLGRRRTSGRSRPRAS